MADAVRRSRIMTNTPFSSLPLFHAILSQMNVDENASLRNLQEDIGAQELRAKSEEFLSRIYASARLRIHCYYEL
jgi:hypothetical protein